MRERTDLPCEVTIDECDVFEDQMKCLARQITRNPDKELRSSFPLLRMQQHHIRAVVGPLV